MNRIENAPLHTKIEHFLPKETYKPHEVFEYKNLFAACNGGERDSNYKPRVPHCDSAKSDKDPTKTGIISPLSIDCHTHFLYLENGAIQDKTPLGKSTIESLKLDCKRLNTLRKAAIETYLYDESIDFKTEIGQLSIAKNGELQAFCLAIIQVLADYV
jgi:uncharacterized protein (TIGR02646 family)